MSVTKLSHKPSIHHAEVLLNSR